MTSLGNTLNLEPVTMVQRRGHTGGLDQNHMLHPQGLDPRKSMWTERGSEANFLMRDSKVEMSVTLLLYSEKCER